MNENNSLDNLLKEGHNLLERGQYEEGLEVFQQADNQFPNVAEVKYGMGLTYYRLEQYEESLQYVNLALQLQQVYPLALVRRGMTYNARKQSELANADFIEVLKIEPQNNEDWRARGIAFDELKRSEEALSCYEEALNLEPNDYQAWYSQGLTLKHLKRYEKALECLDRSLDIKLDNIWVLCVKAEILAGFQKYFQALGFCEIVLEINSDFEPAQNAKSKLLSILSKKNDNQSQHSQLYSYFLFETLRTIHCGANKEQIYLLFQKNIDKLNINLVQVLKALQIKLPNLKLERRQKIGIDIVQFSELIVNFPLGNYDDNIEIAIAGYEMFITIFSQQNFPTEWATIQNKLGVIYRVRIKGNKAENMENAISACENALIVRTQHKFPLDWAATQNNLGNAYIYRIKGNKAKNIENAISAYQKALIVCNQEEFSVDWAATQNNLGIAYDERIEGDKAKNIENAISAYRKALIVRNQEEFSVDWAATQNNLGNAYRNRIEKDRAENIENAIFAYENALEVYTKQDFPVEWASIQNNLGATYDYRHKGNIAENIEKAISAFENALEVYTKQDFPVEWASIQNNLGTVHDYRHKGNIAENIEKAISAFKNALKIRNQKDFPIEWAITKNNLGIAYIIRIKKSTAENIEKAILSYEDTLKVYTEQDFPLECAKTQNNLGIAYRDRIKGNVEDNVKKALSLFKNASIILSTLNNYEFLKAIQNLGYLYFKQSNWQSAIEAYSLAIEAIEKIRLAALNDDRRQEIITESIEVYENIVQACINSGQVEKAIEYTERSRCRRLVDLMASNDLYSDGEIPSQVAQYLQQYADLQKRIDAERKSGDNNDTKSGSLTGATTRDSRASFEAANERIKQLEAEKQQVWQQIRAFDKVLSEQIQVEPISFATIRELIPDNHTALLSCYVTKSSLQIFVVFKDKPVRVHTTEFNRQQLEKFSIDSWFKPYLDWLQWLRDKSGESNFSPAWQQQMPKTLAELAQHLDLTELVEHNLQDIRELIVIPHLYLHSIPFAALPINSSTHGDSPASQLLGERFRLRILPSAQILQFCHQRTDIPTSNVGTVEDADNSLPFSQYEGEQIAQIYQIPAENRLRGKEQANVANYRKLIEKVQVLHSSHHASSRLDNPLESQLQLADGTISLGEIMSPGWRVPNLTDVFLSCCETNLGFAQLSDDPLTIGTGFLCAGARSVVSTLWSVEDMATALFSIIYYELRNNGLDRSAALQQAQHRLKNLSGTELAENYYPQLHQYLTTQFQQAKSDHNRADSNRKQAKQKLKQLNKETPEYEQTKSEKSQWNKVANELYKNMERLEKSIQRLEYSIQQTQPFAHPYYWAGFISQGLR